MFGQNPPIGSGDGAEKDDATKILSTLYCVTMVQYIYINFGENPSLSLRYGVGKQFFLVKISNLIFQSATKI